MSSITPSRSSRVIDPDTREIDGLLFVAASELRAAHIVVAPEALAQQLGVPVATVAQHWIRLQARLLRP